MFPDIMRDEVFRLETRRLWLRWPTVSDGAAVAALLAQKHAHVGSTVSLVTEAAAVDGIARWRAESTAGQSLALAVSSKDAGRPVIGMVRLTPGRGDEAVLDYGLAESCRGQGLMAEAVFAALDATFMLSGVDQVTAGPRAINQSGRRVLERCGFTFVGAGLGAAGEGPGLSACDMFCLDRKTWRSLKSWAAPDFGPATLVGAADCLGSQSL